MKQDRFLIGILTGISVLVAAALIIFLVHKAGQNYGPEDTPAGVLHNYMLAIDKGDYERAYRYLADIPHKPTYDMFLRSHPYGWTEMDYGQGVEIGKTTITDGQAVVEVHLVYEAGDPFYRGYQSRDQAILIRQNGAWKIKELTWGYRSWLWYRDP